MSELLNDPNTPTDDIAALIDHQREDARHFIEEQQDRLEKLESLVTTEINDIHDSIQGWSQFESKVRELHASVESEATELDRRREEIEELERTVEANETERLAELNQQLQTAQRECGELHEDIRLKTDEAEKLSGQIDDLQTRLDDLQDQFGQLEREVEQYKQQAAESSSEIESLNSQIAADTQLREETQAEFEKLRQQMAEASEYLADRERQIANLESQVEESKSDADRYRAQCEMETEALRKARSERDALKESISSGSSEGKQLRLMLNDREREIEALQQQLVGSSTRESVANSLREQLSRASEEMAKLKSEADAIKADRKRLKEEACAAVEERDRKIACLQEQADEASDGTGEENRFREENAELLTQLERAAIAVKKARAERDSLREELAGGAEGQDNLRMKLREVSESLEDRDRQIQNLQEKISELTENGSLGGGVSDRDFAELKKRFEAAATKVGQLTTLNQRLEEKIAASQENGESNDHDRIKEIEASYEKRMRAAEVEMSLERAQNARTQTELKEKLRELEFRVAKGGGIVDEEEAPRRPRSLRESMGLD